MTKIILFLATTKIEIRLTGSNEKVPLINQGYKNDPPAFLVASIREVRDKDTKAQAPLLQLEARRLHAAVNRGKLKQAPRASRNLSRALRRELRLRRLYDDGDVNRTPSPLTKYSRRHRTPSQRTRVSNASSVQAKSLYACAVIFIKAAAVAALCKTLCAKVLPRASRLRGVRQRRQERERARATGFRDEKARRPTCRQTGALQLRGNGK